MKIDLGCGKRKREGFIGVDSRPFDGVDIVCDLSKRWPWADNSVEEVHASHVVEHFDAAQRVHFVNELYRVLKVGGKATIITPHWASARAYGDLTHQWPPVSEFWYLYLNETWRNDQAPHNDMYQCNFDTVPGGSYHPRLFDRNDAFKDWAATFYKEAIQDQIAVITKLPRLDK